MISKQILLGLSLLLGSGVMLAAVATKPKSDNPPITFQEALIKEQTPQPTRTLTADIETEKKIIAEKQKQRELEVASVEQRFKELLDEQEKAKNEANIRAEAEAHAYAQPLSVQTRPESAALAQAQQKAQEAARQAAIIKQQQLAAIKKEQEKNKKEQTTAEQNTAQKNRHVVQSGDNLARLSRQYGVSIDAIAQANNMGRDDNLPLGKSLKIPSPTTQNKKSNEQANQLQRAAKGQHLVQKGDNLARLSRQYGVSIDAIAQANNMGRDDNLPLGKSLKIPSAKEIRRIENAATAKAQEQAKKTAANQRLAKARQEARRQGGNERYAVQVSLASNQESADKIVKQLKAAGYKVSTSQSSRGVRVMVGSERSREAASALKDKIKHDGNIDSHGAWVTKIE